MILIKSFYNKCKNDYYYIIFLEKYSHKYYKDRILWWINIEAILIKQMHQNAFVTITIR